MATTETRVRFSCPQVDESASAQQFPWEKGVPVNTFWDNIDWTTANAFLRNVSDEEYSELPIDPNSTASHDDKLKLLISLLDAKLAKDEATVAPESLAETNPKAWRRLIQNKWAMQLDLGMVSDAGQSLRKLIDHFGDTGEALNSMKANQLSREGDYIEAEKLLVPCVANMDADMTKASPQAIGSRRSLLSAIWKQGPSRRADAEEVLAEIKESIKGMVGTKYEVYVEEEEAELDRLLAKLGN